MKFAKLEPAADEAEAFQKVMANGHRLMILCELIGEEKSVVALHERLGLGEFALSRHLARLRDADIVRARREQQTVYYSLQRDWVRKIMALLNDPYGRDRQTSAAGAGSNEESRT